MVELPIRDPDLLLAKHYLDIGQSERALSTLTRVGSGKLENPVFWYLLGLAHEQLKQPDQAAEVVHRGLALAPEAIYLLHLLRHCESQRGDLAAAERAILKALQRAPEDPNLLCCYARLVAEVGQLDKAERLMAKAIQIAPEYQPAARLKLDLAYLRGHDRKAIEVSKQNLAQHPDDFHGHYMLGALMSVQRQPVGANPRLNVAARMEPTNEAVTGFTRQNRFLTHWLLRPLHPIKGISAVHVWMAFIVLIVILLEFDQPRVADTVLYFYIFYVIYTLLAPIMLKNWQEEGQRQRLK
ncbi:MAG: tetratricopeptide repeat protein [Chloroflexota bacterium]